jgi:hypothetical protein
LKYDTRKRMSLENEMREYIIGFEMIKRERVQFQISKFKYARREGI